MIDYDKVAQRVMSLVQGAGHTPIMFDLEGSEVSEPVQARRFFVAEPNYMVTINSKTRELVINLGADTSIDSDSIKQLNQQLRSLAQEFMLKTHVQMFGKQIQPKDFANEALKIKQQEDMLESKLYGSALTSYQDYPTVRLVVKHSRPVDPENPMDRTRNIRHIYIQQNNQRQRFPINYLPGARAMANHCAQQGSMDDKVGQQIVSMSENMLDLRKFLQYSRRRNTLNEKNQQAVFAAKAYQQHTHRLLDNLSSKNKYLEACQECEAMLEAPDRSNDVREMFSVFTIDPKVETAVGAVNQALSYQNQVLTQSQQPHQIQAGYHIHEDVFEYEDPKRQMAHRLKRLTNQVVNPTAASQHVLEVARKLEKQCEINQFDREVVENFLKHLQLENS
jgi:hypothetical protein